MSILFPLIMFTYAYTCASNENEYSKVPNKRRRRLLIFTVFSSVGALIPVSTIIKFCLDSFKNSINLQPKMPNISFRA